MRIIEETPDRLVLEDRPWVLWLTLVPVGATTLLAVLTGEVQGRFLPILVGLIGLGAFWVLHRYAPLQRFDFDRTLGRFTHSVRRLTGAQDWVIDLDRLEQAAEQALWHGDQRLTRIALVTEDGPHPLEAAYSGRNNGELIATITAWLNGR
ncbi:hypothetical protein GQ651_14810 [Alphaproteobacteria bacterium GH1-50]|uniref:PH (Pleckstrin Homology) domain-containing protein n=1 Tax=Kangsaoukella pontilimi TaxID=2691042 RepID=A0A7C9MHN9_9RHOB|nr:hypothetical protein [Kangsaoukella pontilimi]MXQ09116.1 hypothetical protein [Kangsaoukella pontilimi]